MVYSVTQLSQLDGLFVVDVQSILSVVSIKPHDHHVIAGDKHFFVREQKGLEMSLLHAAKAVVDKE